MLPVRSKPAPTVQDLGLRLLNCVFLHRHGDRTPSVNFYAHSKESEKAKEEINWWKAKMPPIKKLEELSKRFPAEERNGHQETEIESSAGYPFGHLTQSGLKHLHEQGSKMRKRYRNQLEGIQPKDIYAQSTNFARTKESCRSFLEGFLPPEWSIPIHVLEKDKDFLNPWESNNGLSKAVQEMTVLDKAFEVQEEKHQHIRESICKHLPFYNANPEKFLWVYSGDYYVCHDSHDRELHEELEDYRDNVLNHVAWRFLRWYHNEKVGQLAIGDFASAVKYIFEAENGNSIGADVLPESHLMKKFFVFSAHDVTLLPFMVSLGIFSNYETGTSDFDKVWPEYGTVLSIEHLVNERDERFIRVLRNDHEIYPLTHLSELSFLWEGEERNTLSKPVP
mmetsp:Transcript_912/g.1351  ORF Transcript_912/g.1351 Transcript_912/m.1351 type:complete len:393 (+) Transcript_912:127-1305(+)